MFYACNRLHHYIPSSGGITMQMISSLVLAITLAVHTGAELVVKIPPGINLKELEVRADLPASVKTRGDYDRIEIIIYYFSRGIEKFSYSESNALKESQMKGEIQALIKFKSKKILRKALFIDASGASRDQILQNFSRVVTDTLAGN